MSKYSIYTDGGFSIARNIGGWGCIVVLNDETVVNTSSGIEENSTSNRMELTAFIAGLKFAKDVGGCIIYSDSQYIVKGYNLWLNNWKNKDWKSSNNKDIKNKDLWLQVDSLKLPHIKVEWVKAHNGNKFNEMVDSLTRHY